MKRNALVAAGFSAVVALSLVGYGCSSNDSGGTGGTKGSGGSTTTSQGGGTGTTSQGGATGTTSQGGASGTSQGGASGTSQGGASGTSLGGASGGGLGGASGTVAAPCGATQGKGLACVMPTDVCTKTCGPVKTGTKPETCAPPSTVYVEGDCSFPAGDYTCYKVSITTPACPAGTTTATGLNSCTLAPCTPCSGYTDGTNTAKVGYCVCNNGVWSCGSAAAGTKLGEWPCQPTGTSTSPGGTGC